jgi:zinc protease
MTSKNIVYALPGVDNVTRVKLENGITVLIYENHSVQSVFMVGSLQAGSIYETSEQNGLASMTASALMSGTHNRDFDTIHAELENIGADLGIGAGTHTVIFNGKALGEDLQSLIEPLSDILKNPSFPEDQVERLRGERLTGLHYSQQDTSWRVNSAFRENLYPTNHAYYYSPRGTLDTIPQLTVEDLQSFHQTHYGPLGMRLIIVGAIKTDEALDVIRQHLGDWTNDAQPEIAKLADITAPTAIKRVNVTLPGKTQSEIILGTLGPSRFAQDFQATNMVNSILGQFGMMGRIGNVVREREGLAYHAGSSLGGGQGPGAWSISAGVNPLNVEKTVDLCIEEIRSLTTKLVSEEDIADNQAYFTGHLPLQLEQNQGIAWTLHFMEIYELGLDYLSRYHDLVYSLTREDLLAAAQNYLNPDALVIAVAGPGD